MASSKLNLDHQISGDSLASVTRRRVLGYGCAGALAALLPGCSSGGSIRAPYSQTIAWAQQEIAQAMNANPNVAAMSIALLKGNAIVWQQAFGLASVQNHTPATIQTRFNVGSVTKVVTALAAVILQDRGLITLDTPIVQYLPAFTMLSPEYKQITTRHLLSHASGLPGTNPPNAFSFVPLPGYAADTEAELANSHLKHLPGELAVYCNDGFTLVEQIVLALTGQSFPAFVQANIFAPLNMVNSSFLTSQPTTGEFAYPYLDGKQYPLEYANPYAAGGMSTTPLDMMNMAQMFLGGGVFQGKQIVSAAGIADMATDQTSGLLINPSPEWRWGLGWDSVQELGLAAAGVTAWSKNGGTVFFSSEFFIVPAAQMALMVTGNDGYPSAVLAEDILLRALQEDGTLSSLPPVLVNTAPPVATAPAVADAAGIYGASRAPLQVIVGGDSSLELNVWNGTAWTPLDAGATQFQYRSDGWWWSDSSSVSYRFDVVSGTDEDGNAYSYRYLMARRAGGAGYYDATLPLGQQLAPLPALDAAWQARMGSQWTVTNESPETTSTVLSGSTPSATLSSLSELPGYILLRNSHFDTGTFQYQLLVPLADDRGGMSVKVPVLFGRDLYEISFATANGSETMTIGGWNCAPA